MEDDRLKMIAEIALERNFVGDAMLCAGRHEEALRHFSTALKEAEGSLGPGHVATLNAVYGIACSLQFLGTNEALPLYMRAHSGLEEALGPDHRDTTRAENGLGTTLQDLGRPVEACEHLLNAAVAMLKDPGLSCHDTFRVMGNLGYALMGTGDHLAAELVLRRSVSGLTGLLGSDDIGTKQYLIGQQIAETMISDGIRAPFPSGRVLPPDDPRAVRLARKLEAALNEMRRLDPEFPLLFYNDFSGE